MLRTSPIRGFRNNPCPDTSDLLLLGFRGSRKHLASDCLHSSGQARLIASCNVDTNKTPYMSRRPIHIGKSSLKCENGTLGRPQSSMEVKGNVQEVAFIQASLSADDAN